MTYLAILISAKDCKACQKIVPHWPAIQNAFPQVRFDHIQVPSVATPMPQKFPSNKYPADLQKVVKFFPFVILTTQDNWEKSRNGSPLGAKYFNYDPYTQSLVPAVERKYDFSHIGIKEWISDNIHVPQHSPPVNSTPVISKHKRLPHRGWYD